MALSCVAGLIAKATPKQEEKEDFKEEPATYKEAVTAPDAAQWKAAMDAEVESLNENETWDLVDLPLNRRALRGRWVYRYKRNSNGSIIKHKARWVVKGFEQRYGVDYNETYASVVKSTTYKVAFAIAAYYDYHLEQMDVKTAFLNGILEEKVFVTQPTGYTNGTKVCRLNKALYGLKQSPRVWYQTIHKFLTDLGFKCLINDASVFKHGDLLVFVYVDDILLLGPAIKAINSLKRKLGDTYEMTDCGPCEYYLGMKIKRDRKLRTLTVSQKTYLEGVLDHFRFSDLRPVSTSMEQGLNLQASEDHADAAFIERYQSAIGSLMYAMTQTRPDIAYSISVLSRFAHNPNTAHWNALKRVFRYIRGTTDVVIRYGGRPESLGLQGSSDSDWGGDNESRRSTSGYVFQLANGPVSWRSKRQAIVALSSTEAEYIALTEATKEAIWMRSLLTEMQLDDNESKVVLINMDNQGAMALTRNPQFHQRTKHIDIRYHFVRHVEANGGIKLAYTPTDQMIADGLTKPLQPVKFRRFIELIGLHTASHEGGKGTATKS